MAWFLCQCVPRYVLDPDLCASVRTLEFKARKEGKGQTLKYRTSKMRLSMNNIDHLTVHMDTPYRDSMTRKDYVVRHYGQRKHLRPVVGYLRGPHQPASTWQRGTHSTGSCGSRRRRDRSLSQLVSISIVGSQAINPSGVADDHGRSSMKTFPPVTAGEGGMGRVCMYFRTYPGTRQ